MNAFFPILVVPICECGASIHLFSSLLYLFSASNFHCRITSLSWLGLLKMIAYRKVWHAVLLKVFHGSKGFPPLCHQSLSSKNSTPSVLPMVALNSRHGFHKFSCAPSMFRTLFSSVLCSIL